MPCPAVLHHIPLQQGLWLISQLDWQPVSPRYSPASALHSHTQLFTMGTEDLNLTIVLAHGADSLSPTHIFISNPIHVSL